MSLSQVVFLFCAYLGLASVKHAKSKLSLVKFFPYFPDDISNSHIYTKYLSILVFLQDLDNLFTHFLSENQPKNIKICEEMRILYSNMDIQEI